MVGHEESQQFVSSKEKYAECHDDQGCRDRCGRHWEATPLSPEGKHRETLKTTSYLNSFCSPSRVRLEKFLLLSFPGHKTGTVTRLSALVSCGYCDKHHQPGGSEGQSAFCHRSGGWTSTVQASAAPRSPRDQQGRSVLASSRRHQRRPVLGLWQRHPSLSLAGSLRLRIVPPPCMSGSAPRCPLSIRTQSR